MKEIQRILKPSKVVVFVDRREPSEVIEKLSKYECVVRKIQLPVGDYLCSSRVCIERKSILPDTPVIIKINDEIKIVTIEEAYSLYQKGFEIEVTGVDFIDKNIGWLKVSHMSIHNSDDLYGISFSPKVKRKFENEKNISIIVTGGHNIYVLRSKRIKSLPTSKLHVGDFVILIPPKLPEIEPSIFTSFEDYLQSIQAKSSKGFRIQNELFKLSSGQNYYKIPKFNEDFFFILGFWAAEGLIKKSNVVFTQKDEEKNKLIEKCLKRVFGNFSKDKDSYNCGGKVYRRLFLDIFGKSGAENKHIPSIVFNAPKKLKAAFIRGYFFGDGWRNINVKRKNPQLKACSKSKLLIVGLSYLFYSLGIENSVITTFKSYKGKRRKYYEISIKTSHLNKFLKIIEQIPTKEIKVKKSKFTKIPYYARSNFYKPLLRLTQKEVKEFYRILINLKILYEYTSSYIMEFKEIVNRYNSKKEFSKKYGINYSTLRNITNGYAKSSTLFINIVNIIRKEKGLRPIKIKTSKLKNLLKKLNVSTYLKIPKYLNSQSEALVKNIFEKVEKKIGFDSIFLLVKIYEGKSYLRRISSIEPIKERSVVYDFSVRNVENFVGGLEPILLHNTYDDFVNSVIDGRLFQQAEELKDNFSKPILLIEGDYFQGGMNENAIKAALASIVLDYDIPVIMTRHEEETARTIYWLTKREQMVSKKGIGIKGKKKPKTIKELQEHIVSSLPGVSVVLSKRILKKFKTIKKFADAEESEILKVDGVGKVLAKRLHRILNEEYGGNA